MACDIPSHSYQYSFNPKPDWSALYSPGNEIRDYIEGTAEKYSVTRFIKLEHKVEACKWMEEEGKWHLDIKTPQNVKIQDECDVIINARGLLNTWQWPDIDGLHDFEGELMHSASWNKQYDFTGKRVGVIGVGSSAIQIIPSLQKQVKHMDCFIRGQTWIQPPIGERSCAQLGLKDLQFTQEQIETFRNDSDALLKTRMQFDADSNSVHAMTLWGTELQKMTQERFGESMEERLKEKPEYLDWLKPTFAPGCRRLTPGPGFLEALVEDNVTYVRDDIASVNPKGIKTQDGKFHEIDALICATGFRSSGAPPFEVAGRETTLQQHSMERDRNYLSLATDHFPNHFFMLGPNTGINEGSLTIMMESTGDYIVKAVRKIQKESIKAMTVKSARVDDFMEYCDEYFKRTVYMQDCNSWFRRDGQGRPSTFVSGLWPGSTLHCIEGLRSPRWEDYSYRYWPQPNRPTPNEMAWLGNGWTLSQLKPADEVTQRELAFYLAPLWQEREIGLPVHPFPAENEQYRLRTYSY